MDPHARAINHSHVLNIHGTSDATVRLLHHSPPREGQPSLCSPGLLMCRTPGRHMIHLGPASNVVTVQAVLDWSHACDAYLFQVSHVLSRCDVPGAFMVLRHLPAAADST